MRKRYLSILISLTFLFLCFFFPTTNAWDDCPYGIENDTHPGLCGRYRDTNNDSICDLSQSDPNKLNDSSSSESSPTQKNQTNKSSSFYTTPLTENKNVLSLTYSFIIIATLSLISYILGKRKKKLRIKIKICWNILLLVFFIPSAITGVFLILFPTFPKLLTFDTNFISLHTITSFFFMWVSAYHILWHTSYYVKGIKKLINGSK